MKRYVKVDSEPQLLKIIRVGHIFLGVGIRGTHVKPQKDHFVSSKKLVAYSAGLWSEIVRN